MDIVAKAITKYVRISPKKLMEITRQVQGMPVLKAIDVLQLVPRKAARLVVKSLRSAVANAENNHNTPANGLVIARALTEQGPTFRRFRPAARGSAHPYKKRTSHLVIELAERR